MRAVLARSKVVPVLTIEDAAHAVPLAEALLEGGIGVLEVTLRTGAALAAVQAIARHVPETIVGVGTITRPEDCARAVEAGAAFAVSPGFTPALAAAAGTAGLPYLPGVATASEVIAARAAGFTALKFFPAHVAGGIAALKAFAPLFPDVVFCPTGGIGPDNLGAYLALANVVAVGGSWMAPADRIAAEDWAAITRATAQASAGALGQGAE
jgi:2-dehydro-3-deoxyphosphogluconate aldolase/(4S)-4-hydroxy-2-oxoglutarate aldolase